MKQGKILLLDTDPSGNLGKALREIFEASSGLNVPLLYKSVKNGEPNLLAENISKIISDFSPNMIFFVLSHSILRQSTLLLQSLRSEFADIPAILVMEDCQPGEMFVLLKCGATDFITPPFKSVDILPRIWRLLEEKSAQAVITQRLKEKLGLKQIIGKSPLFLKEVKKIPTMARCDVNILISGETGTGKEVCARAIHYLSPRMSKPFMPVNCGAIPVDLIENELFGHKSGAFTSANSSQQGLIQDAEGGTLFLDEIDCLPLLAQVKLLRFLQEKEYRPLGSTKICQVDVRVVAATCYRAGDCPDRSGDHPGSRYCIALFRDRRVSGVIPRGKGKGCCAIRKHVHPESLTCTSGKYYKGGTGGTEKPAGILAAYAKVSD